METLSQHTHQLGRKFGVYFLYIAAQIFVLASLLLTTTGIVVHVILMILTVFFYFATALKNPGIYEGAVEPNHEDVNSSKPEIKIPKQKSIQKRWQSQKECHIDHSQEKKSNTSIKKQEQNVSDEEKESYLKNQKKPSISNILAESQQIAPPSTLGEPKNQSTGTKKQIKKEILNMAMTVFNNFAIFRSKNNISQKELPQAPVPIEANLGKDFQAKAKLQPPKHHLQVPVHNHELKISKFTGKRQQGVSSMIGREDFGQLRINSSLSPEIKVVQQAKSNQPKTILQTIDEIKRYCRICQAYQPLRVRHCHTCDRCIATYDHHCPWMANCIGQKNKLTFMVYLIFQTLQLFTILVDLIRFLSGNVVDNSASVGILLIAVILIFALIVILVSFHFYLIARNLTTWELLRWDKVQYLCIFDKKKIASPFTKGFLQNFKTFWTCGTQHDLKDWKKQLCEDLSQCLIQKKRQTRFQVDPIDSDRRPFKSEKIVRN